MKKLKEIFTYQNNSVISGLTNELNLFYIKNLQDTLKENVLVVTNTLYEATKLYNSLQTYNKDVLLYPVDDFHMTAISESPELKFTRLETLKNLNNKKTIIVTNLMGFLKKMPEVDNDLTIKITNKEEINRKKLVNKLENIGYTRSDIVNSTGEYAIRGLVIDIFPIYENNPIRLIMDDNTVELIKYYDAENQISNKEIETIEINPVKEVKTTKNSSLLNYVVDKNILYINHNEMKVSYKNLFNDKNMENYQNLFNLGDLRGKLNIYLNTVISKEDDINYKTSETMGYEGNVKQLQIDVNKYVKNGYQIYFSVSDTQNKKEIKEIIPDAEFVDFYIKKGFILNKIVVISEDDIKKTQVYKQEYHKIYNFGHKIKSLSDLEMGDYIVHISHGIGKYNGIKKLTQNKIEKDFLQILYAGKDKIYIPVEKINNIYKYSDKESSVPKLNNLSSSSWERTKKYVQKKIKDISEELILLYDERLKSIKSPYITYPEEELFASGFEHTLTSDQLKAVDDIKKDLENSYPMDRLLCGDVGFGKTEVAFRAVFQTILNNDQVIYLAPTTILSTQQYEVAKERFKDWPIEIALLNRFTTPKETKRIIKDLKTGKIDVLFGTHRVLSKDIELKKLGLLVVDEEQRFGVSHKERIKQMKSNVNVLTLSATPIPRTLKMSLSGLRDLSIIDTPPLNRFPIQTYVVEEYDMLIKNAVYRELSRDGQVYILYNRVETINQVKDKLNSLMNGVSIGIIHGQMNKREIEKTMIKFKSKEIQILLCTTIIENGIDLGNVNTLIVYESDKFGLSQLYQIRGRIGRGDRVAYAYLMFKKNKLLTEDASKRLKAIQEFTELGSGYKIALRDLSIRGAGDVFGSSQSGFVDAIGINLYLKMMNDEIRRKQGETIKEKDDVKTLIDISTHIGDDYVKDEKIKIYIHQLINKIENKETFKEVEKELSDRFGKIPNNIIDYMYKTWFDKLSSEIELKRVDMKNNYIEITLDENKTNEEAYKIIYLTNKNFEVKKIGRNIFVKLKKDDKNNYIKEFIKLFENLIQAV